MLTRSAGLQSVFRSRLIVAAALLLALAATPASGSESQNATGTGRATSRNDRASSGSSSIQLAPGTAPTFAWPASVSADNRRFLDQKGNVYLLKMMSSWAMAQNCTNAEITSGALEGLKAASISTPSPSRRSGST